MKIVTRKSNASAAYVRFTRQYPSTNERVEQKEDLKSLGQNPNPDRVDKIMGNKSWTEVYDCNECSKESPKAIIVVGEEPDNDSSTAYLCKDCITKAYNIFNEHEKHGGK